MFEASLVESTPLLRNNNRWPALISITIQSLLAASLIAIPLVHPEVLALHSPHLSILPPLARPTPPPPPPPVLPHVTSTTASTVAAPVPVLVNTPSTRSTPTLAPNDLAPTVSLLNMMPGTNPTGTFSVSTPAGTGPAIAVASGSPASISKPAGTPHVSTGVSTGHLFEPITAVYPPIALAAHQQGTVVVEAIISKSGQIESAHVTSGPPMFQNAALDAVRRARYHPFLLNGQPTEVATTISINFHLGS